MGNMERFAPLHFIATSSRSRIYALIKKGISTFQFSAGYLIKEVENFVSRVHIRYRNTGESLGELETAWKHSCTLQARVPTAISCTSTRVSITVWKHGKCFLFFTVFPDICIIYSHCFASTFYLPTVGAGKPFLVFGYHFSTFSPETLFITFFRYQITIFYRIIFNYILTNDFQNMDLCRFASRSKLVVRKVISSLQ